jgi:dihydrofolate reductase
MSKPNLIIISAVSLDGVIGVDNEIPWHIPEDFKHFRDTTIDNIVIIGYNTYLTLPPKALEGRRYLVLNAGNYFENKNPNVFQFARFDVLQSFIGYHPELFLNKKIFVAGGAMVYETLIDFCDEAIITWVNKEIPNGNKRFPIDKLFANFEACDEHDWRFSKSGEQFKITHYIKI